MNIVVDLGNTRAKAALFDGDTLIKKFFFQTKEELKSHVANQPIENVLFSSVAQSANEWLATVNASHQKFILSHQLPLPIKIRYATPETLGVDRIAAACGALSLFPERDCLVIDAGTCINYEFLDAHANYLGGAISPGVEMRFKAMHTFTARLPLSSARANSELIGTTTETCMQSGVMNGILNEMEGIISQYKANYPALAVLLCGGDAPFFENNLKHTIFAAPELVLMGLNRILRYNAS